MTSGLPGSFVIPGKLNQPKRSLIGDGLRRRGRPSPGILRVDRDLERMGRQQAQGRFAPRRSSSSPRWCPGRPAGPCRCRARSRRARARRSSPTRRRRSPRARRSRPPGTCRAGGSSGPATGLGGSTSKVTVGRRRRPARARRPRARSEERDRRRRSLCFIGDGRSRKPGAASRPPPGDRDLAASPEGRP